MPDDIAANRLRVRILGIDNAEASFARRRFPTGQPLAQARLELVGRTFVGGYRAGLVHDEPRALASRLDAVDAELRGFAYEGAAMALALFDQLHPRAHRLEAFLAGPGAVHTYMVHVGAGWAMARLHRGPGALRRLDPVLRWLALDGYGFHAGYFAPRRHLVNQRVPRRFSGYALRAFDQGLGRSAWFAAGGDPARAAGDIGRFPATRQPDLWSGLALAISYAGPVSGDTLGVLRSVGGAYATDLAQGAAFAAAARARAGNPAAHTELACRALTGLAGGAAADLVASTREDLPQDCCEPDYEAWREGVRRGVPIAPAGVDRVGARS